MLNEQELDALMLGMRWVAQQPDTSLAQAALDVLSKAEAVLPSGVAEKLFKTPLFAASSQSRGTYGFEAKCLRDAIRLEKKILLV